MLIDEDGGQTVDRPLVLPKIRVLGVVAAVLALPACASLPANAPTVNQISKAAKTDSSAQIPYTLVPIDAGVVDHLGVPQSPGLQDLGALAADPAPQRADLIRKGDTLTIAFFEVGVSLFGAPTVTTAADSGRAPVANMQTLVATVREDGSIDLPYIGTIRAGGTYPEQLAATVKARMRPLSESPDVIVTITDTLETAVYIGGAVSRPGRFRLTTAHEHLLDALALAGSSPLDVNELEVTLVRGARSVSVPLNQVGMGDPANVRLLPGDRISLQRVRQSYTVFGATDKVSQVPFEAREVSLAEALARAGGPADSRANPRGIYIFRLEKTADGQPRATVYQLNLLQPDAYFIAQKFAMRDKDVILFANSSTNALQKALGLISQLFSPAVAVRTATQ
jgi:polysaccharide export outer membrane protein